MDSELRNKLQTLVDGHNVVLFMKGNRNQPQCGFSARVVGLLEDLEADYQTYDVFSDSDIRSGMKDFTNWPTFPQLYINQEFVGGCDIITEMGQSGELATQLGIKLTEVPLPDISCSPSMITVLNQSISEHGGGVQFSISKQFQYDIGIGPKQDGQYELIVNGVPFYFSRGTAQRANGISFDYNEEEGGGVIIDNPNEPKVKDLSVEELSAWIKEGKEINVYDVRSESEREIAKLDFAEHFTPEAQQKMRNLAKDALIIFQCRSGGRSLDAGKHYVQQGFSNVYNLVGGINAWSERIDTSSTVY
jgi:monothiol glutaredoxin